MPFYRGPGLHSHCIPIDHALRGGGAVQEALNDHQKSVNGSRILLSGVAYKKDVANHRESPAFDILDDLRRLGATVEYVDRRVPEVEEHGVALRSVSTAVDYGRYDAVVIVTDHSDVDYARMLREAKIVVDTRNVLRDVEGDKSKVVRL
jgi:UDP-N-acetyl-D-glucosamine dehydrogenase